MPDSVFFSTLYGPLYDPASLLADENGFRKDYIEAMRELKITNIRWRVEIMQAVTTGRMASAKEIVLRVLTWHGADRIIIIGD